MNIDNMPASREMDALIAEKIFKIKVYYPAEKDNHKNLRTEKEQRERGDRGKPYYVTTGKPWRTHGGMDGRPVPCFSDNVSAAWQVVEKMDRFTLQRTWGRDERGWKVECWKDSITDYVRAFATTAPLAICRAALCVGEGE